MIIKNQTEKAFFYDRFSDNGSLGEYEIRSGQGLDHCGDPGRQAGSALETAADLADRRGCRSQSPDRGSGAPGADR